MSAELQIQTGATTVNNLELTDALTQLAKAVDSKSHMPILHNVRMQAVDGVLTMWATDMTTTLTTVVECGDGDLDVCVPIKTLIKVVKPDSRKNVHGLALSQALNNGEMELDIYDEGMRTTIIGMDVKEYFPTPVTTFANIGTFNGKVLLQSLRYVLEAVSTDETRYNLNGVFVDNCELIATDGHRLHRAPTGQVVTDPLVDRKGWIIGKQALNLAVNLLKKDSTQAVRIDHNSDTDRTRICIGDYEINTEDLTGNFPDYEQAIPKDCPHSTKVDRKEFEKALKRLQRIAPDKSALVRMSFEPNMMILETGEYTDAKSVLRLPCTTTDALCEEIIGYNVRYVLDALKYTTLDTITWELDDELAPTLMHTGDGESAVIMPMRT